MDTTARKTDLTPLTPAQTRAMYAASATGMPVHVGTFPTGEADIEIRLGGGMYFRYMIGKRGKITHLYCGVSR